MYTLLFRNPTLAANCERCVLADEAQRVKLIRCAEQHRTESKKLSNTCLVGLLYQPGMTMKN